MSSGEELNTMQVFLPHLCLAVLVPGCTCSSVTCVLPSSRKYRMVVGTVEAGRPHAIRVLVDWVVPPPTPLVCGSQAHRLHRWTLHHSLPILLRVLCHKLVAPILLASLRISPTRCSYRDSLSTDAATIVLDVVRSRWRVSAVAELACRRRAKWTALRSACSRWATAIDPGMLHLLTSELSRTPSSSCLLQDPTKYSTLSIDARLDKRFIITSWEV